MIEAAAIVAATAAAAVAAAAAAVAVAVAVAMIAWTVLMMTMIIIVHQYMVGRMVGSNQIITTTLISMGNMLLLVRHCRACCCTCLSYLGHHVVVLEASTR